MSGRKACRSIRPRKVFGKCFPKCFVHRVWYRFPIQRNCRFFFLFSSLFFSSEFDSRKKYSNPFRVPKKSMFRGKREKKEKQIEGKRFHRRIGRVRNVFVQYKPAESGLLFTLHGIHSSPAKRVKTKSESLFVTSFDVPINSFEITAAILSRKFKFPANRRLGSNLNEPPPFSSPSILEYILHISRISISSSA